MNCNNYKNCRKPTKNNPLMNLLPGLDNTNKGCDILDKKIKTKVEKLINRKYLSETNRKQNNRNFYKNPSTSIPDDRECFINFLYGDLKKNNCKHNKNFCGINSSRI